jgi:predicted anti-sigma-YlaC factor YlaD
MSQHITHLLDDKGSRSLTVAEQTQINEHVAVCVECRKAHVAASVGAQLLSARAAVAPLPSPFFHTRVAAALRQKVEARPTKSIWQMARSLILAQVALVLVLAGLTIATPEPPGAQVAVIPYNSPESVVFSDADAEANELNNDQLIDVVFNPEESDADSQK